MASDQQAIVECILTTAHKYPGKVLQNTLAVVDQYGNTALHLAVVERLPDMYDFIYAKMEELGMSPKEIMEVTNADDLTPLTLAASLGDTIMFPHLLSKMAALAWVYGPVRCKVLPLRGLEQPIQQPGGKVLLNSVECLCSFAPNAYSFNRSQEEVCAGLVPLSNNPQPFPSSPMPRRGMQLRLYAAPCHGCSISAAPVVPAAYCICTMAGGTTGHAIG